MSGPGSSGGEAAAGGGAPGGRAGGGYEIRPLEGREELVECWRLQGRIWGEDFTERVPPSILHIAGRLGGVATGAWGADGALAGFIFGLTGLDEDGEPVHWSDMLAVRPGDRGRGLGTLLKRHQREHLLETGVGRVHWTFDPLESRNAHLNFGKLGIVVREYRREMYGDSDSPLHRAIGTDRFLALWLLRSRRVEARLAGEEAPPEPGEVAGLPRANPPITGGELPRCEAPETGLDAPRLLVTIPADIHAVIDRSPEAAREWRERTRGALEAYLGRGYEVRELVRDGDFSHYLLALRDPGEETP